jgi:spoIIIJ-associated protein
MKTEENIKEILEELLIKLGVEFSKITVEKKEDKTFSVNVESEEASLLIGHHGDTIKSIQHILKVLCWSGMKLGEEFNVIVDIGNYRKKQEESVLNLAERKVEFVRKTHRAQSLPPMSPYFRRLVHMKLMEPGYEDVETYSSGEGEMRHIIIKPKKQ